MRSSGEVTGAEIARIAGVGRAAVSNWRKRYGDFPPPVGGSTTSPTFALVAVERWLAANDRAPADDARAQLRRAIRTAAEDTGVWETVIPHLAEQLIRPLPSTRKDPVLRVAADIGSSSAFDLLLEAYLEVRPGTTPPELAALMVMVAGVKGRAVHDPVCGTGAVLSAAVAAGAKSVHGQDADEANATMARVRLALHQTAAETKILVGDLRRDAYPRERFDVILCHPPFAVRDWGAEELAYDPRWQFGVPPRQESELAWVQHALAHTRPGGTAVVVVPPAVASRPSGRRIRAELLRRGALRAVVAMPPGVAAPAHLSLQLWLLSPPTRAAMEVLLVDGASLDAAGLAQAVDKPEDARAYAVRIPVVDLLDEDVDLTPARHLAGRSRTVAAAGVLAQWEQLTAAVQDLPARLPRLAKANDSPLPMTTLAELVRAGALTMDTQAGTAVVVGDVIVPTQGAELTAEVATEAGALSPGRVLLRPNPDRLDRWFLAGFVARPSNARLVSSLGSTLRLDVRRAQVPRVPLELQQTYAETFRALHQLRRELITMADNGRKAIDLVAEGLALGTIGSQA